MNIAFLLFVIVAVILPVNLSAKTTAETDEILFLARQHVIGWNEGKFKEIIKHYSPKFSFSVFGLNHKLLAEEFNETRIEELFEAGLRYNLRLRHVEVSFVSEQKDIALVTGYLVGDITSAGKEENKKQGTWRFSSIRRKDINPGESAKWKILHLHISELRP